MGTEESHAFLTGGGEMGDRIRCKDWSQTSLGPLEDWSPLLRTTVGMVLEVGFPCVLFWGKDQSAIYNDAYHELLGEKPESLGLSPVEMWPEATDFLESAVEEVMAGKAARFRNRSFTVTRYGYPEEIWVDVSFSPVRDESNRVVGVLNIVNETTEQVLADRRQSFLLSLSDTLRKRSEPLEIMAVVTRMLGEELKADRVGYAEMNSDGSRWVIDGEWRVPELPSMAGEHRLEDFGETIVEKLLNGETTRIDDLRVYLEKRGDGFADGKEQYGIRSAVNLPIMSKGRLAGVLFVHQTAPRTWTDAEVNLIQEAANRTWNAIRRGRAEERLLRTEAQRSALIAHAPIGMYLLDPDLRIKEFNEKAKVLFSAVAQPIGMKIDELFQRILPQEEIADIVRKFRDTLETGESHMAPTYRGNLSGGKEIEYYEWEIHRVALPAGRFGVVCYFIDVSSHVRAQLKIKKSERELRQLSESLEARVADRTVELQEQTDRLRNLAAELASAEQRERKRLAALLHDELQQFLVAANMQMDLIARHVSDDTGRQAADRAGRWIREAAEAARDLTRQLRPPALYEGGLLPALHWLASEMKERHGIDVTILNEDLESPLNDDVKALVFECIRELLFNVAKYALVDRAEVKVWQVENCLRVLVSDEGRGFDIELVASRRQSEGFGLFSIRERLAALEGDMTIESEPGRGTRIEIAVPLPETAEEVERTSLVSFRTNRSGKTGGGLATTDDRIRVLVVDDHAMVREGIANVLDEDPRLLVVGAAGDGIEALEAIRERMPDVVLMDLNMPRMNGIEAIREIRRHWPAIIVIGLSVQSDETTAKSMIDAGAAEFLSKAGDSEQIIAAITRLGGKRASGDAG